MKNKLILCFTMFVSLALSISCSNPNNTCPNYQKPENYGTQNNNSSNSNNGNSNHNEVEGELPVGDRYSEIIVESYLRNEIFRDLESFHFFKFDVLSNKVQVVTPESIGPHEIDYMVSENNLITFIKNGKVIGDVVLMGYVEYHSTFGIIKLCSSEVDLYLQKTMSLPTNNDCIKNIMPSDYYWISEDNSFSIKFGITKGEARYANMQFAGNEIKCYTTISSNGELSFSPVKPDANFDVPIPTFVYKGTNGYDAEDKRIFILLNGVETTLHQDIDGINS